MPSGGPLVALLWLKSKRLTVITSSRAMVQVCLTSGEEVLRQEGVATLRELHLQLGATGPASSVPTFLREDGHVLLTMISPICFTTKTFDEHR